MSEKEANGRKVFNPPYVVPTTHHASTILHFENLDTVLQCVVLSPLF